MKKIIKGQMVKWLSHFPLAAVALRAQIAKSNIRTEYCDSLSTEPKIANFIND